MSIVLSYSVIFPVEIAANVSRAMFCAPHGFQHNLNTYDHLRHSQIIYTQNSEEKAFSFATKNAFS
jgi:hypothetical protein